MKLFKSRKKSSIDRKLTIVSVNCLGVVRYSHFTEIPRGHAVKQVHLVQKVTVLVPEKLRSPKTVK